MSGVEDGPSSRTRSNSSGGCELRKNQISAKKLLSQSKEKEKEKSVKSKTDKGKRQKRDRKPSNTCNTPLITEFTVEEDKFDLSDQSVLRNRSTSRKVYCTGIEFALNSQEKTGVQGSPADNSSCQPSANQPSVTSMPTSNEDSSDTCAEPVNTNITSKMSSQTNCNTSTAQTPVTTVITEIKTTGSTTTSVTTTSTFTSNSACSQPYMGPPHINNMAVPGVGTSTANMGTSMIAQLQNFSRQNTLYAGNYSLSQPTPQPPHDLFSTARLHADLQRLQLSYSELRGEMDSLVYEQDDGHERCRNNTKQIKYLTNKLNTATNIIVKQDREIQQLRRRQKDADTKHMKFNIKVNGLEAKGDKTDIQLFDDFMRNSLKITQPPAIVSCYRLGQHSTSPLIVKFSSFEEKKVIFQNVKNLKGLKKLQGQAIQHFRPSSR